MFGVFKKAKPKHHFSYTCAECGKIHKGPPSYSFRHPVGYADALSEQDGAKLMMESEDWCVISTDSDIVDYFIRVTLEIPINGTEDAFMWGVWVTQSKESFERYHNSFGQDQSDDGSFGWLFADFAPYDDFSHLACDVCWQAPGMRPKIILQDRDHPLVRHQQNGISIDEAVKIATRMHHEGG